MEVGNGSDVPGITSHGACAKAVHVIEEIGDDDLDKLQGKPCGRG